MGGSSSASYPSSAKNVSGSGTNWGSPLYARYPDTQYATASLAANGVTTYLWCDHFDPNIVYMPQYTEIVGIKVGVQRAASAANKIQDLAIQIIKYENGTQQVVGSSKTSPAYWETSDTTVYYGGPTDTWGLTAQQLEDLLPYNGINQRYEIDSGTGVSIRARAPGGSGIAKVNAVTFQIYWRYKQPVVNALSASSPDSSTLNVSASVSNYVTGTDWWIKQKDSANFSYVQQVSGTGITINNLVGGSRYYVQCVAINPDQTSAPYTSTLLTTAGSLPSLVVTNVQSASITLQASASGTVNGYHWWYRPVGATTWIDLGTTTSNTKTVSGLTPSTDYEFRVQPFSNESAGLVGDYATVTQATAPLQVQDIAFSATNTSLTLTAICTAPDVTHTKWWLRAQESPAFTYMSEVSGTSYTITDLVSGSHYYVQVQARIDTHTSDIVTFGPFATSGNAPSVALIDIAATSITAQASASGVVNGYRWWIQEYGQDFLDQGITTGTTKTFTGLDLANKTYTVKARPYSNEAAGKVGDAAYAATLIRSVTLTSATASSLSLAAVTAPGVTHTTWWFRHKDQATWQSLGEVSGTTMTISNLIGGSHYMVQVKGRSGSQESVPMTFGPFATSGNAPSVQATEIYPTSVVLQASATGAVSGYRWWKRIQGQTWSDEGTTTSASRTFGSLTPGTIYEFQIRPFYSEATGRVGNSAITVNAPPPEAPTNLAAVGIAPNQIQVTCSPVASATLYRFEVAPAQQDLWQEFATSSSPSAIATLGVMNTLYRFRVRAQNQYGSKGPYSSIASAYTRHAVTGIVRAGTTALAGVTVVEFSWPDLLQATGQITPRGRATTDATGAFSITTAGDGQKRVIALLKDGYAGRMYYDVSGNITCDLVSAVSRKPYATWYAVSQEEVPFPSHSLGASITGITSATLSWHRRARILSGQEVQLDTSPAFVTPITLAVAADASELALPPLSEYTQYYARTRTKLGEAASAWSDPVSFRTGFSILFGLGAAYAPAHRWRIQEPTSYGMGHGGQAPWGWRGKYSFEFGLGCSDTLGYGRTEDVGISEGVPDGKFESIVEEETILVAEEVQ